MKQIYLLRHEEVEKKYRNRYYGHLDVKLSLRGRVRSLKTAKKLNIKCFDAIFSSDLSRTRFILNGLRQKVKPILTESLREKSWGIHEGLSYTELEKMGFVYENFEQWLSLFDGESLVDFQARVLKFYKKIISLKEKKILIVTHSGVIKVLLAHLNKTTIEEEFMKSLPYGSLVKLNVKNYNVS